MYIPAKIIDKWCFAYHYKTIKDEDLATLMAWINTFGLVYINKLCRKLSIDKDTREDIVATSMITVVKILQSDVVRSLQSPMAYITLSQKREISREINKHFKYVNRQNQLTEIANEYKDGDKKNMLKIIHIVGKVGIGKSTVCSELSKRLGLEHISIDDFKHAGISTDKAWHNMAQYLKSVNTTIIIESNIIHNQIKLLKQLGVTLLTIELKLNENERLKRVKKRGTTTAKSYPLKGTPDITVDLDGKTVADAADALMILMLQQQLLPDD